MCVFLFPFGEEEGNIGIIYSGVKLKSVGSIRTMSTSTRQNPVRIYPYPDKDRKIILDENKEQSGVYR
jgi:hypothetical protein